MDWDKLYQYKSLDVNSLEVFWGFDVTKSLDISIGKFHNKYCHIKTSLDIVDVKR